MADNTRAIIQAFVAILIGVVLTPIVAEQAASANVTGTALTVITLIPVFFALGILILSIRMVAA